MKLKYILFLSVLLMISLASCDKQTAKEQEQPAIVDARETETLEFSFNINKAVYLKTNFGEAPQIAIWLEFADSSFYKTVWVSHRAGKNDWVGKVECTVALPSWDSRRKNEKSKNIITRIIDAITGATIKEGKLQARVNVLPDKILRYYIEVNASGDYSAHYPYWSKSGFPDTEGNGQPSIIYSGLVDLKRSMIEQSRLIGHTNQFAAGAHIYDTIGTITTAKDLVQNIRVHKVEK